MPLRLPTCGGGAAQTSWDWWTDGEDRPRSGCLSHPQVLPYVLEASQPTYPLTTTTPHPSPRTAQDCCASQTLNSTSRSITTTSQSSRPSLRVPQGLLSLVDSLRLPVWLRLIPAASSLPDALFCSSNWRFGLEYDPPSHTSLPFHKLFSLPRKPSLSSR